MDQIKCSEKRHKIADGEIFMKLGAATREEVMVNPDRHLHNIIVDVASDQIAEWAIANNTLTFPRVDGIMTLAVGTGDIGWDLQNPPPETAAQTQLESELTRKVFANQTYIDPITLLPTITRTNIVDYTTSFLESEAVGPLVEMGLFAGTGATGAGGGTMINYLTKVA